MSKTKYFAIASTVAVLTIPALVYNVSHTNASFDQTEGVNQIQAGLYEVVQTGSGLYSIGLTPKGKEFTGVLHVPAIVDGNTITVLTDNGFEYSKASAIYFENSTNIIELGFYTFKDSLATNEVSFPSITEIKDSVFRKTNFKGIHVDGNKITKLGMNVFSEAQATNEISFPLLTHIPESAFEQSQFPKINIDGNKILTIGQFAFADTKDKRELDLPHITIVPKSAFAYSKYSKLNLNYEAITSIGPSAFERTNAKQAIKLTLITEVPSSALRWSLFTNIELDPNKITKIGNRSFMGIQNNQVINLPRITEVPNEAFAEVKLAELKLNYANISKIGKASFKGSQLTHNLSFPKIKAVPDESFLGAQSPKISFDKDIVTSYGSNYGDFTPPVMNFDVTTGILNVSETQLPIERIVCLIGGDITESEFPNYQGDTEEIVQGIDYELNNVLFNGVYTLFYEYPGTNEVKRLGTFEVKNGLVESSPELPDTSLQVSENTSLNLKEYHSFDNVTYITQVQDPSIASVNVEQDTLKIKGLQKGETSATVHINNNQGNLANKTFNIFVTDVGSETILEIMGGDLTLEHESKPSFSTEIDLTSKQQIIEIPFEDILNVQDARGTQEGWSLNVRASQLTETTSGDKLPKGSLSLTKATNSNTSSGIKNLTTDTVIDTDSSTLVGTALIGYGGGTSNYSFENGLKIVIDPEKITTHDGKAIYSSTLNWTLTSGPTN